MNKHRWESIAALKKALIATDTSLTLERVELRSSPEPEDLRLDHSQHHRSLLDVVFQMGYKKLTGVPWTDQEKKILADIDGISSTEFKLQRVPPIVNMLKGPPEQRDLPQLK
ncbi:hypothetical protein DM01DRAFT_1376520 [Hesseltinella vesiculosa]|uniref:Uncharacterized protein n=1 Tax=Hesseltinella vesiculosa TaxID=101127 RepID=A0A1X2GAK7_9FUNG|nr:hypothetical protein DM01DRAFT_1376520 [Hesseltinella vesiculosa]